MKYKWSRELEDMKRTIALIQIDLFLRFILFTYADFSVAKPNLYIPFEGQKNKLGTMATMVIKSNFCLSYWELVLHSPNAAELPLYSIFQKIISDGMKSSENFF